MEVSKLKELDDLGFNLFPLRAMDKRPIAGINWKQFQTEKYTGEFPDSCNVAVICGEISNKLFVVDLDNESIYDDLPEEMKETYTVKTGKGYHLYFHYDGLPPANKKLDDHRFRHIDIKSEGGYVLGAGSIHPETKKPYVVWTPNAVKTLDIPRLKEILGDMGFNVGNTTIDELKQGVAHGSRDDSTFKVACYYVREGLFDEALRFEVEKMNQKNDPPLPQKDIDRIIEQAETYEKSHTIKHIQEAQQIREELESEPTKIVIQDINAQIHEGIPIIFDAMITAVGERRTYIKKAEMYCPVCNNGGELVCDEYYRFSIPRCKKDKVLYMFTKKETAYIQQIIVEEFLEDAKHSSPIAFNAEITDEHVGEAFMGERKTLTARFRSILTKDGRNDIVFDISKMEDIEQKEGCLPTPEELQSWKDCPQFFDRVTASILPDLMMDFNIIQSAILWGAGGTGLNGKRAIIHMADIGDAQLGKSELALRLHKLLVGSGMTVGGKTSGAGLTIGMTRTHNDMLIPRAGFFPQYTGHHTIIDEGDKMGQPDQNSCLEVMEQMTATLTKVGIPSMTLPAECPLFFTGNPKGGKFSDKYPSIMDNFNMTIPFISRFDLVWVMQDKNDPELDKATRKFIRSFKERKDSYMQDDELQRYFEHVKQLNATIPEELMDKIDELHEKMRKLNTGNGLPIGWRQYHGLYRLITASATAHLREIANESDFELVEKLITTSLQSMRMDIETGEIGDVVPEKMTKEKIVMETWTECMDKDLFLVDKDDFVGKLGERPPFNQLNAGDEFNRRLRLGLIQLDNDTQLYRMVSKGG